MFKSLLKGTGVEMIGNLTYLLFSLLGLLQSWDSNYNSSRLSDFSLLNFSEFLCSTSSVSRKGLVSSFASSAGKVSTWKDGDLIGPCTEKMDSNFRILRFGVTGAFALISCNWLSSSEILSFSFLIVSYISFYFSRMFLRVRSYFISSSD